ncbi:MAG: TetR family transcriptional regulator [Candidatus Melainabacteria bacterium]|nr:TetR family transcriptional regulator [Candidatus Melainabacteria bacterium]
MPPQHKILPSTNERYDEVLSVAARLIARDGFEKASIRAIAENSKLSQAGLYYYFSSKEDLLYQLQKHTFTALRNSLAARLDPELSPEQRLKLLISNHLEFFTKHMNELRVCAFEFQKLIGKYYEDVQVIRRDYFRIAHTIINEILDKKWGDSLRRPDSRRLTMYLFGTLNWIHMWLDTDRATDLDTMAEEIADMVLYGIARGDTK